jgi:hypothetical protein
MEVQNRKRRELLTIRLSETERAELDALAEHERVSISDVVRRLVRDAYEKKVATTKGRKR